MALVRLRDLSGLATALLSRTRRMGYSFHQNTALKAVGVEIRDGTEMRLTMPIVAAICLAASVAYCSQQPSQSGQEEKARRPANQQGTPDVTPHEEMKFFLVTMSHGRTKSGAGFGESTYERLLTNTKVYLCIVHLDSPESAKKEYDDNLRRAERIITQGKVQDKPATKPATIEDRAEIIAPATRECKEATTILATAGRSLRIITSCSGEAAIEFERQAKRDESKDDRDVVR
jgi:hypothetical protein